ncbi:MAG: putative toxin-antitoxin system toxin component, family [Paucimonas sp.]|nr:putative toxin-antitoxin system toxin component, family [Paucimonas sp.]
MIPNRIVIDTNVLLDLFVFRDPRWQQLLDALEDGSVQAWTRADCACEWRIVLGYPHLPLDEASRALAMQCFTRLIHMWQDDAAPADPQASLPACRDRDDQKFLELARDARAAVLITKDRDLLKLARQTRKRGLFDILTPEKWLAARAAALQATTLQATTLPAATG